MTIKDGFKFGLGVIGAFVVVYVVTLTFAALLVILGG
jgi:hypothetical protein